MCKTNVFQHILNETANKTEIPPPVILSSDKRAETVDARYIVIELCFRSGMYPCAIADKTGLSVRAVNHILSTFDTRISSRKMMRMNYEVVKEPHHKATDKATDKGKVVASLFPSYSQVVSLDKYYLISPSFFSLSTMA